ncbi:MAG: VWA domain-containing protein [Myxococcaceae bacterium]|nr:VWA domain-containing protein [Myxococcaceae bacterium]
MGGSHIRSLAGLVGAVALLLSACTSPVDAPGSTVPGRCTAEAPLVAPQKTDILFVIDDSGSMKEEQEGIASELPAFIDELKKGGGVGHDFQVGVITTSVYQNANFGAGLDYDEYPAASGRLQAVPGTGETILRSGDPDLVEKFAKLVQQGTGGSGQETPFEAVRLAVTGDLNPGFLRDGARLLVVVVSDEDDCSEMHRPPTVWVGPNPARNYCDEQNAALTRVEDYAEIFRSLTDSTGAHRQVLWAAIAPVSVTNKEAKAEVVNGRLRNVDCPTSFAPGKRQREMAALFDESLQNLDSICSASYRDSLLAIAQIANVTQSLEVRNVPDPRLLKVELTRADGSVQACTLANGGITWQPPTDDRPGRVFFTGECPRKFDDESVVLRMICAG